MALNNFNYIRIINTINVGNRIPIDNDTLALWIFDGSEVDGAVKDWSDNQNHLIPNEKLEYEFSAFGKVLKVSDTLSFESKYDFNINDGQDRCLEIYFNNTVQNYGAEDTPYNTYSGLAGGAYGNISTFITESEWSISSTVYFGVGRAGTIQTINKSTATPIMNRDFYLPFSNNGDNYQNDVSPISGDSYPHPLHSKNWFGIAINYPLPETAPNNNYFWLNGHKTDMESGNYMRYPPFGFGKLKLFPFPDYNFVKNIAFIRLSKKQRNQREIAEMLNYFSSAEGYVSNLKIYDRPLGKYRILNELAESAKTCEFSLDYRIPRDMDYVRSGVTSSNQEVYENARLVYSGLPVFDYGQYGESKGLVIENGKENYFKYDSGAGAYKSDFSNGAARWYPAAGELNFDSCTQPVHGDYYGYSGPDTFNYWNLTGTDLICSGIYTMSCWVKKTDRVTDNGFYMTLSRHGTSNWLYVYPYVEVIDAHPLFDKVDYAYSATNKVNFKFIEGEHYSDWQRLWVTFKIYTDQVTNTYWQITHDNRVGASTAGQGDTWAIDCHQFEEGWLSSWKPEYIQSENPGDTFFSYDLSKYTNTDGGTILFDYRCTNAYSGLTQNARILLFGNNIEVYQNKEKIYYTSPGSIDRYIADVNTTGVNRIAISWNLEEGSLKAYQILPTVEEATGTLLTNDFENSKLITLSGTTLSGVSFRVSNFKIFNRQLSLDELTTYN